MIASVILSACLVASAPDEAETDAFVRYVAQRVAAHIAEEHYAAALREIEKAEHKHALPDFVFMRAVVEEKRGNCRAAVPLYDRFLETDPEHEDEQAARDGRIRCGAEPEPVDEPEPEVAEIVPPPPPRPRPWYADPTGGALVITGTVALGVGLGLFVQARADERAAERADTLAAHQRHGDRARTLGIVAASMLATGGALVVGGVIRYAIVARRGRRVNARLALGPALTLWF